MKQPTQTAPVARPDSFHQKMTFYQWDSGLFVLPIDDPGRFPETIPPGVIGCHVLSPWSRTNCL
jgi:hypothetical protein